MEGDIIVVVHDAESPTEGEWKKHVQPMTRSSTIRAVIVDTTGGGPNAKQRQHAKQVATSHGAKTAVMTSSALARGTITAFHWLGDRQIKAFAPDDIDAALAFVERSNAKGAVVITIERLRAQVG